MLQLAHSYDEQQLQEYLFNLKINAGSINGIIAAQALNVAKHLQTRDSLNADGMVSEQPAGVIQNQVSQAPAAIPSRGDISRSSQDLDYLAHTIYGEARGESFEGKVAVAAVVLNRADSGQFGNNIKEVFF